MTKCGIHQEFKTGLTSENQCNSPQQQKKKREKPYDHFNRYRKCI